MVTADDVRVLARTWQWPFFQFVATS